jgi:hypothetical protein
MRESLKQLFSQQVKLDDGTVYYYSVSPYNFKNALGNDVAVLQEYVFTKKGDDNGQFTCKLYRTKDGNWYDLEDAKTSTEKSISRLLKSAVDGTKNTKV